MSGKQVTILDDQEWPTTGFSFTLPIQPESTALGVIDVQRYFMDTDGNIAHTLQQHSPALQAEFLERVESMTVNVQKLLEVFRNTNHRAFFTRHGAQTDDGADLIKRRRSREDTALASTSGRSGHMAVKGNSSYEVDLRVAPQPGELVFDKNTSSAFHTTPIDLYLRNMQIETIVLTGVAADQCVLATAIDAADRGFHVIIASDACTTLDPGSAEATQILFGRVWGYVMTTDDIIHWLKTGQTPTRTRLRV